FDGAGHLYVNVGAPSNACQQQDRRPGSPGIDPCPLLAEHGGIWRFSADRSDQRFSAAARYATGLRNDVAIAWNRAAGALYTVMMGRDQLHDNWPQRFTVQQSAELPAEELLRIEPARDTVSGTVGAGASRGPRPTPSSASPPAPPAPTSHRSGTVSGPGGNYGWPYCYYDGIRNALVLAPEYGGDGKRIGRCARYRQPLAAFPAHWAPEAIAFYDRDAFPARYRGGAFIAFHGSWNRAPLPQQGFVVAFVPFAGGRPSGPWRVFADGFAGRDAVIAPGDARFHPVGVAVAPDGALYVADSQRGWIWRITYSARQ
ncbi:MAG: hypothetical protein KGJ55_08225, partial [Gammaproteobacteria bacterium]|nr:hypothetical protein [Gammaproteobacteria bacterium]